MQGNTPQTKSFRTIEVGGKTFLTELHRKFTREPDSNTTVFVYLPDELALLAVGPAASVPTIADFPDLDLENIHTRIGEYPEVDAAWKRCRRATIRARRTAITLTLTAEELDGLGTLRWRVNAGCSSCPCSPGFVASSRGENVWVTVFYAADPLEAEATVEIANGLAEHWDDSSEELIRVARVIAEADVTTQAS